jgi:Mce-associated membrane protein
MAEHSDAAEQIDEVEYETAVDLAESVETLVPRRVSRTRTLLTVGLVILALIVVALAVVGGWLGYRVHQDRQAQAQRNLYVQVARQTAVNLTTIDYTEVDADIKRILDSSTGGFHDDFQQRSQPFVDVVKKVQSKSEGTVAEAALLSQVKDQAQVLVAVEVKTTMAAGQAPQQEPHRWRMRLTVQKTGDGAKVSNVDFVP